MRNSVRDALRDLGQNQSVLVIGAILDFIAERKPATAQQRLLVEVSLYRKVPETAQPQRWPARITQVLSAVLALAASDSVFMKDGELHMGLSQFVSDKLVGAQPTELQARTPKAGNPETEAPASALALPQAEAEPGHICTVCGPNGNRP